MVEVKELIWKRGKQRPVFYSESPIEYLPFEYSIHRGINKWFLEIHCMLVSIPINANYPLCLPCDTKGAAILAAELHLKSFVNSCILGEQK